jgi:hypothetical protein
VSGLVKLVARWLGLTERTTRVERRLRRERPRPDARFAVGARRAVLERWAIIASPPRWRLATAALMVGGLLLLVAALAVAAS